jgi:phytol kinase
MSKDILNTIILASSFLALFGVAEVLYHFFKVRAEFTRKMVHVGTGLLSLLFPLMLSNHWFVLFLCVSFGFILVLSIKFNLLKSINAIDRESVGSLAYPVSVYMCYFAFRYLHGPYFIFYIPILVLAISDPIAALTGKRWPIGKYTVGEDTKTLMGSGMFFLSAFFVSLIIFYFTCQRSEYIDFSSNIFYFLAVSLVVALVSAVAEAFSRKGYDNITIPGSILLIYISIRFIYHYFVEGV